MKTIKQNLCFSFFAFLNKKIFIILFLILICFSYNLFAQDYNKFNLNSDTTKPVQYRRTIEPTENQQSYEQKYFGKDINEIKRSLFPLESTGIWTELNPKVPRVDYIGVHFVNKDKGWACGDLGAIIKTTNGGQDWTVSQTNTTTPILKVKSFNGLIVLASGYDGLILRSVDGGETFTLIPSGVTGDLWGLQMINDTLGWTCGTTTLLKTTDAGVSWQLINTPGYTGNLWAVEFLTESYGFIAADGKVLRTTNGGIDWEIITAGDNQPLYIVDIIDSLHIAAAGYGGTSYRGKNIYSSDGGFTWITGGPLTFEPVNDIKYVNLDTGYVVLNNTIGFKTTNRGQNWTGIGLGGDWEMQFLKEQNIGYSIGTGLRVYKSENSFENWHRLIINDDFSDVFFVNEETGFAVSGVLSVFQGLYKTTNSGVNWNNVSGSSGQDILFLDSLTGFIGSDVIKKTTDGGMTWYVPNGGEGGAGKIFFINETTGWAIRSNIIYKTTDRGETWITQFTAPTSVSFNSIYFVDSLYGWTAGGRPYKTADGGNNWIQQTNTTIWNSDDVYFKNINIGWIIKRTLNSSLVKTTDTGINWNIVPEIISAFKFHYFPDPQHWIINGTHRYITENGGDLFIEITSDVHSFNSFHSLTNKLGFAVGNLGLIIRYDDTSYIPVELFSFEGRIDKERITLIWETASELNNKGFYIEKSFDKKTWKNMGFVNGNGTTTEITYYSFIDKEIKFGVQYYRLKQIDYDGHFEYSKVININIINPKVFELYQNFPNPFNPSTKIVWQSPTSGMQTIKIYDILGRELKTVIDEYREAGIYEIEFDASFLSSGIYFYKLTVGGNIQTKKMILLR